MLKKIAVLDFVESKGVVRRKDLVKFMVELAGNTYDSHEHRGHYSTALCPTSWGAYLLRPSKNDDRYLFRCGHGLYKVRHYLH